MMKHLLALMAFLFFLILVVSGVMAVGNVKQSEQMAQRIQQVSELKAELRKAEQRQQELTLELAGWRSRSAALRSGQAAVSRRLGDMLQLARSKPDDPADLRAAFAATGADSAVSAAAWLPDISRTMVSKAVLPMQGEELIHLTALENVLRRLIGGQAGGTVSKNGMAVERDAAVAERDTAVAERDTAIAERDTAITEKDAAILERDAAVTERDSAIAERDNAVAERDTALTEKDAAVLERDAAVTERNALLIQQATIACIQSAAASIEGRLSLLPQPAAAPASTSVPAPAQPAGRFASTGSGSSLGLFPIDRAASPVAVLAVLQQASAEAADHLYRLLKPLQAQLFRIANGLLEFHCLP